MLKKELQKMEKRTLKQWALVLDLRLLDDTFNEDKRLYTFDDYEKLVPSNIEVNITPTTTKLMEIDEVKLIEIDPNSILVSGGTISFKNYDGIKFNIEHIVNQYKSFVIDDEVNFKKIKKDTANFNKIETTLDTLRKAAKKELLKPYETMVSDIDKLKLIFSPTVTENKKKIDAYSLKIKEDKKAKIVSIFNEFKAEYPSVNFLELDKIMDASWLNKGPKIKAITGEIEDYFLAINSDMKLINLEGELGARIKTKYLKNGYSFVKAKEVVLKEVAREVTEQIRITNSMKERELVVNKDLNTTMSEVSSIPIIQDEVKVKQIQELNWKITGDKNDLAEILEFARTKDVTIEFTNKGEN